MTNVIVIPKEEWDELKRDINEAMRQTRGAGIALGMNAMSDMLRISDKINEQLERFETEFIPVLSEDAQAWQDEEEFLHLIVPNTFIPLGKYRMMLFK